MVNLKYVSNRNRNHPRLERFPRETARLRFEAEFEAEASEQVDATGISHREKCFSFEMCRLAWRDRAAEIRTCNYPLGVLSYRKSGVKNAIFLDFRAFYALKYVYFKAYVFDSLTATHNE